MAQQQVQAEGQRMFEEMNSDIESFLEEYGKSKGYTYILGSSMQTKSVLYGEASLNITDAVIDALNENYAVESPEVSEVPEPVEAEEPTEAPAPVN